MTNQNDPGETLARDEGMEGGTAPNPEQTETEQPAADPTVNDVAEEDTFGTDPTQDVIATADQIPAGVNIMRQGDKLVVDPRELEAAQANVDVLASQNLHAHVDGKVFEVKPTDETQRNEVLATVTLDHATAAEINVHRSGEQGYVNDGDEVPRIWLDQARAATNATNAANAAPQSEG